MLSLSLEQLEAVEEHKSQTRGELHLGIPASSCFLGITDFPGTDTEELAGMVELRVEDVSPFPMDRTYFGWERLQTGEGGSRVLYVLCPHSTLDPLHAQLQERGLTLHRVDVDVPVWLGLILEAQPPEGSRLILLESDGHVWLIAVDNGAPGSILSLGEFDPAAPALFLEELDLALTAVEADRGALEFAGLSWWGNTDRSEVLGELSAHVGVPCEWKSLEELPPFAEGFLRRAEESGARPLLDLSPDSWKQEEADRIARKKLIRSALALASAWLLLVAGFLGTVKLQERSLRKLRQELTRQEQPLREIRDLSERVRSLMQFTDRRTSALEVLRIMAESAPGAGRVVLRDLTYRKAEGVTITGEASGDFFLFQEALSAQPVLRVEDFDTREVRGTTEFRVVSRWRWEEEP